jgi:hypothetical protein
VALYVTFCASQTPGEVETTRAGGQVIAGGSVSFTVTVNVHVAVLPAASVAVATTVVTPTGNVDPDGGVATTVTAPAQVSVAVTTKFTWLLLHWPASLLTTMLAGQVICGGVTS